MGFPGKYGRGIINVIGWKMIHAPGRTPNQNGFADRTVRPLKNWNRNISSVRGSEVPLPVYYNARSHRKESRPEFNHGHTTSASDDRPTRRHRRIRAYRF